MNSREKIADILTNADRYAKETGNDQLIGLLALARMGNIDLEDLAWGLLPETAEEIDRLMVVLAVQALERRSDGASTITIAVDGGDVYSVREVHADHAIEYAAGDDPVRVPIHHQRPAEPAVDEPVES